MHNGLLRMGQAKMAGSVGNVVNIADLLQKHTAETVRFLLLSTHYRSPIEYSDERLAETRRALEGFYRFFERYERITKESLYGLKAPAVRNDFDAGGSEFLGDVARQRQSFLQCMDDDFNTGGAVGALHELLTTLNRFAEGRKLEGERPAAADVEALRRGAVVLKELSQILGMFSEPQAKAPGGGDDQLVGGLMRLLIDLRAEARKAKNFALGDQIRNRLKELNITLEDRPGGTGWRRGS
jgi:cysteinyl-tRNA synthetase